MHILINLFCFYKKIYHTLASIADMNNFVHIFLLFVPQQIKRRHNVALSSAERKEGIEREQWQERMMKKMEDQLKIKEKELRESLKKVCYCTCDSRDFGFFNITYVYQCFQHFPLINVTMLRYYDLSCDSYVGTR